MVNMLELQDMITLVIIGANIILAAVILFIYYKSYRVARSKLTIGLMFFALAFLVESILSFYFYDALLAMSLIGFTTIHFFVNLFEMIGLIILLYVTWD
jgi:hypothetical protein